MPKIYFIECLRALKKLEPFEVLLVDDCSSDEELVNIAKSSGFRYLRTSYQSGYDGVPFNLGIRYATGDYVCRVDSDDILLELPDTMETDFHLAVLDRTKPPVDLDLEELILAPRAIHNGIVVKKQIIEQLPLEKDDNIFNDVLLVLRLLYRKHSYAVHPRVNYLYRKREGSLQTSKPQFIHRMRQVQTVARFCDLENVPPPLAIRFLELAMLNVRFGSNSRKVFEKYKSKT